MPSLKFAAFCVAVIVSMMGVEQTDGCGFPMPPPPMPMCCCGGRKKREVVQPLLKTNEMPCPQQEWRKIMEQNIVENDPESSVHTIQSTFYRRYQDAKFIVVCAKNNSKENESLPSNVHLSSSGDGYCNVTHRRLWCQAVSLSA